MSKTRKLDLKPPLEITDYKEQKTQATFKIGEFFLLKGIRKFVRN